MSTRSFIGQQNENGTVTGIYCHSDGHIDDIGVGGKLLRCYADREATAKLLELGDLSILRDSPFDSLAYGRDRGERGTEAKVYENSADFLEAAHYAGAENHTYLHRLDGNWYIREGYGSKGHPRWPRLTRVRREAGIA